MEWKKINSATIVALAILAILVTLPAEAAAYTYNREAAKNYALTWYESGNPNYKNFGSLDCANFVSQSLYAGGWPMTGSNKWSKYSWFYNGPNYWQYSNTWTVADDFSKFLAIYSGRGQMYSLNHKPWNNYFKVGDIVQIDYYPQDGIWDHTMIITEVSSSDMRVTYRGTYDGKGLKDISLTYLRTTKHPTATFMGYRLNDQFYQ